MAVPMAEVPPHERPRERLVALGPGALTERELLAILLGSGAKGVNAVDLGGSLTRRSDLISRLEIAP